MSNFFEKPILNSPYDYPARHWQLDEDGQPTDSIVANRRKSSYVTPVPKPKKRKKGQEKDLFAEEPQGISIDGQIYDQTSLIGEIRQAVDTWRELPNSNSWGVTPETARLLQHWRDGNNFHGIRPFFCQVEAAEIAIWLTEVAPKLPQYQKFFKYLKAVNEEANPEIFRIALKLATGAGKTTVMAMLIAWQTINAIRRPNSKTYSKGFLLVAPGITIRDRLRVLLPNDPENYYSTRQLLPEEYTDDVRQARIVITNYHAFQLREKMALSKGGRSLLQGRGPDITTKETEGQMVQRVCGDLMGLKNIVVINDEAHHCYREKVGDTAEETVDELKGADKKDAQKNNAYARLWISGIEAIKRVIGVKTVFDLSATPFFLAGSGYREGTLFPWVMSDFSLMDAIECGIVKLPRVPIMDNAIDGDDMPKFRKLWQAMKDAKQTLPTTKSAANKYDPRELPPLLVTALQALYSHYVKTYDQWKTTLDVPPVFIVVCQNTEISKLVYKFISGFEFTENKDGSQPPPFLGDFSLFRNYDDNGERLAKPNTLLIDSEQLESGDALDSDFRKSFAPEIDRYRRELIERTGNSEAGKKIDDSDLMREVMNTVGKKGKLGEQIRCVVSVSMLTEGWDTNTVTHILGIRAFGTQLLCEQVVGRGLRRQSYELNEEGLFDVEYSDILGIPFDFTAKPTVSEPKPPKTTERVHAVRPERDALEIKFPRISGYRVELPKQELAAHFTEDHHYQLSPAIIGPTRALLSGIVGETHEITPSQLKSKRTSSIIFTLTNKLIEKHYRDENGQMRLDFFAPLKRIVRKWYDTCLTCTGDTYPAQVLNGQIADEACNKIYNAINSAEVGSDRIFAITDHFNPIGSSSIINFNTSKPIYATDPRRSQINYVVYDSEWEADFARVCDTHLLVKSYVKNQSMGFEVPYRMGAESKRYIPDFILRIDDGSGGILNLIVEIKGYRGEDAKVKADTMQTYWVPGVNNLGKFGKWAFLELTQPFSMEHELSEYITKILDESLPKLSADQNPFLVK